MLIIHLNYPSQQIVVDWGDCPCVGPSVSVDPSGSIEHPSNLMTISINSSELTAGSFPLDLLGVELGPTMFVVTSRYSTSENDFFFRDCYLLADSKAADN